MEQHPNREVDLDEVEEGEMVEDKLIIPEEFKNYLNQVADNEIAANTNTTTNNASASPISRVNEDKPNNEQPQMMPTRNRINVNPDFNQWRNPQTYQMPSPLNQPQSPPTVATPHTPAARANDMWPCTQYQQAPPPYPNNYNQNGQYTSNASQMQCNYNNGYGNAMNYGMMNYGSYTFLFSLFS